MFVEMMLGLFALIIAGTIYASSSEYAAAIAKGPIGVFAAGVSKFLGAVGCLLPSGVLWQRHAHRSGGNILQLVIRFMRVATSELMGDISPISRMPMSGPSLPKFLF